MKSADSGGYIQEFIDGVWTNVKPPADIKYPIFENNVWRHRYKTIHTLNKDNPIPISAGDITELKAILERVDFDFIESVKFVDTNNKDCTLTKDDIAFIIKCDKNGVYL